MFQTLGWGTGHDTFKHNIIGGDCDRERQATLDRSCLVTSSQTQKFETREKKKLANK